MDKFLEYLQTYNYLPKRQKDVSEISPHTTGITKTALQKLYEEFKETELTYDQNDIDLNQILANEQNQASEVLTGILSNAVQLKASDVHFSHAKNIIRLKYRINGQLKLMAIFHIELWKMLSVFIKVISNMDISVSRSFQDGSFSKKIKNQILNFRVATHPTNYGENCVIRILGHLKTDTFNDYSYLTQKHIDEFIAEDGGLLLIAGATESGKTTSLYSILNRMKNIGICINIMTLEDPVEIYAHDIQQTDLKMYSNLTFASGLRSILRQNPDVILIGEIRDEETAKMTLRAAMTGHKVLSTIHALDMQSIFDRLLEFNIHKSHLAYLKVVITQKFDNSESYRTLVADSVYLKSTDYKKFLT